VTYRLGGGRSIQLSYRGKSLFRCFSSFFLRFLNF